MPWRGASRTISDVELPLATRAAIFSSVGVSASQPEAARGVRGPRLARLDPDHRSLAPAKGFGTRWRAVSSCLRPTRCAVRLMGHMPVTYVLPAGQFQNPS